jgi:hypothetical protein
MEIITVNVQKNTEKLPRELKKEGMYFRGQKRVATRA